MCAGKDEQKPHLHYPREVRDAAAQLGEIAQIPTGDILAIAVRMGMKAIYDHIYENSDLDYDNLARLTALYAARGAYLMYFRSMRPEDGKVAEGLQSRFCATDGPPF